MKIRLGVAWCRVSTDEQANEGASLTIQGLLRLLGVPTGHNGPIRIALWLPPRDAGNLGYEARVRRASRSILGIWSVDFPGYLDPVRVDPSQRHRYRYVWRLLLAGGRIVGGDRK